MGCNVSIHLEFTPIDKVEEFVYEELLDMGFKTDQINDIYSIFASMDVDHTHMINQEEFLFKFGLEPTPFIRRVFKVMDMDNSGELNFIEFIISMWNFLCNDEKSLGEFIYLLVPKTPSEIREKRTATSKIGEMIKAIHMKTDGGDADDALDLQIKKIETKHPTNIMSEEFRQHIYENQSILIPVLKAQSKIRERLLGSDFWIKLTKKRWKYSKFQDSEYPMKLRKQLEKKMTEVCLILSLSLI
jgi:hypothetical protein